MTASSIIGCPIILFYIQKFCCAKFLNIKKYDWATYNALIKVKEIDVQMSNSGGIHKWCPIMGTWGGPGRGCVSVVIFLWLVKGPGLEKMYPYGWKELHFDGKTLRLFLFLERIFPFPRSGLSNLATLGQTTARSRKRKNSLSEKKVRLRVFPSQSNVFPATRNIYSSSVNLEFEMTLSIF